jgi:hypothetical protein
MASAKQRDSWRDAIRFDNETDRLDVDTAFSRWKNTVSGLQSQMRDNQANLRKANTRAAQVAAAGGAGEYGVNTYSTAASDLRKQIEGSKFTETFTPRLGSTVIRPLSDINQTILGQRDKIKEIEKQKADYIAYNKYDPLNPKKIFVSPDTKDYANYLRQFDSKVTTINNEIKTEQELYDEQQPFEEDELKKSGQYKDRIAGLEKQFIEATLNAPEPEAPTLRGVPVQRTPEQISMQRDQTINSSLGAGKPQQKVAPTANQPYLAKQNNSLPLRGYTMSNMRGASQRVNGALLGGNSNKLQ